MKAEEHGAIGIGNGVIIRVLITELNSIIILHMQDGKVTGSVSIGDRGKILYFDPRLVRNFAEQILEDVTLRMMTYRDMFAERARRNVKNDWRDEWYKPWSENDRRH